VLISTGTIRTGQGSPPGHNSAIGLHTAWSTTISSWHVVMSKSSATTELMMCHDRPGSPANGSTVGMFQPSSALRYSGAAPIANVGSLSRKKFSPWSL
jgi:hypothetical protein